MCTSNTGTGTGTYNLQVITASKVNITLQRFLVHINIKHFILVNAI